MLANVWFDEVDAGLMQEIKETVRIKDQNDVLVELDDNAIFVRKPEEDFKLEVFPCVSIYNLSYKFDQKRYSSEPVKVAEYPEEKVAVYEDHAVPFNLTYQIDFWARYQEDMNYMTKTWLTKHFRQFNLDVLDESGVARSCNCSMQGRVTKSDLVLYGERLFHSVIKLQIWVELDNETRYNKPMVTNVGIVAKNLSSN